MLQQLPARVRPAFKALWGLDLALADVVATSTDPNLGAIRLTWWRDRLDDLDTEGPPAGEPRLDAINRQLMPVTNGASLSLLAVAWAPLLNPFPWGEEAAEGLRERGRVLFGVGAQILGSDSSEIEAAGALWSLVDAAHHCSDAESREFLLAEARKVDLPPGFARELRPLAVLAAVAVSDARGRGRLARVISALRHWLTGRI